MKAWKYFIGFVYFVSFMDEINVVYICVAFPHYQLAQLVQLAQWETKDQ